MAECSHCKGTGIAPERIDLECVTCQRKVTITYSSTAEIAKQCESVQCAQCKRDYPRG